MPDLIEGMLDDCVAVRDDGGDWPLRRPELRRFFFEKRARSGIFAVVVDDEGFSCDTGEQ